MDGEPRAGCRDDVCIVKLNRGFLAKLAERKIGSGGGRCSRGRPPSQWSSITTSDWHAPQSRRSSGWQLLSCGLCSKPSQ